jgi:hypothetical protein
MRQFLVCLALTACSIGPTGPDDGDDAPPTDAPPSNTRVVPRTGAWGYDEVTPVSSTCPGNVMAGGVGTFGIDTASSTSFHVVPNDGTAPFTCSLSGAAFDCPERATAMQDLRPALDAVYTARATARGTLASSTQGSGRQEATVTCAGTQCSVLGVFPCTIEVDFVVRAR